jgi:F-type H+-transporting ATPase subunit epsilon
MNLFPLKILTPEGEVTSADVTQIIVRTYEGALGIMAKHEPMLAACPQGTIRIQKDDAWTAYESEPFMLNMDGTAVTILSTRVKPCDA